MLARLLLSTALLSAPAPTPELDLVDRAIELLAEESELIPLVHPANAGSDDFEADRARLGEVERAGVDVLAEMEARGLDVGNDVVVTLSRSDGSGPGGGGRPPAPAVYAAATAQLRVLGETLQTTGGPATTGNASAGDMRTNGLPLPVAAAGLAAVVGVAGLALRRRKRHLDDALDQATIDPLTSVGNRRRLENDLVASSRDRRRRVAVLMVDIDHFKQINDAHGHQAGDAVLREVGAALDSVVRGCDVVYRYGGEEFCILLPGASLEVAEAVAERARAAVGAVVAPGGTRVSASIGVAEGAASTTRASIERADVALYAAKDAGRDRVVIDGVPVG